MRVVSVHFLSSFHVHTLCISDYEAPATGHDAYLGCCRECPWSSQPLSPPGRNTPAGEGAAYSELPEDDIVDPRDVMHEDLATFYLEAAAATKVSRCTPFYRLHRICNSKISNVNIFWVR